MATKFLDKTGLAYFWSKIKSYIANLLSSKADDSDVVHKIGNEYITGKKYFISSETVNTDTGALKIKDSNADWTATPSESRYTNLKFVDANETRIGILEYTRRSLADTAVDTECDLKLTLERPAVASGNVGHWDYFMLGYDRTNDVFFASAPATKASRSNKPSDIVTRGWLAEDTRLVHTSGNEEIDGNKQFIGSETRIVNSNPKLILKDTSIERGTVSSSDIQNFALQGFDKNGRRMWSLMNEVTDHVANRLWLLCYKYSTIQETSDNCVGFSIGYNSNDTPYSEVFGNLTVTANIACVTLHDTNITRNVAPSIDRYVWYCKNIDSNDANLSGIQHVYKTNKDSYLRLLAAKGTTTTNTNDDYAVFCLGFENGVAFATCPSTPDRNNIYDIVTRDWIPRDTRIVHTSGDEAIAGVKDFSDAVYFFSDVFIKSDQPILRLRDMNADRTVVPSSDDYNDALIFYDKDYNYLYRLRGGHGTDGSTRVYMVAYKQGVTEEAATLGIVWNSAGQAVGFCPTPPSGQNDNAIATTQWVNDKLSGVVHTTGNETIAGTKTFTVSQWIQNPYPMLQFKVLNSKRTVAPSSSMYWSFLNVVDDDADTPKRFFIFRGAYYTSKAASLYLGLYKGTTTTETGSDSTTMGVGFTASGAAFGFCPTPASSSNTNEIATTEWVRSYHSSASDERLKQQIDFVPDEVLDAWEDVSFYQFKFNESVEEKGSSARLHNGVVAQRIDKVFKAKNLDVSKYGLFILEKWDKEPDTLDEDGNVICNGREAGEQYSIRYTEMLCMEATYQRRKNKILENRISELETQVQNMLQILESLKGA